MASQIPTASRGVTLVSFPRTEPDISSLKPVGPACPAHLGEPVLHEYRAAYQAKNYGTLSLNMFLSVVHPRNATASGAPRSLAGGIQRLGLNYN
jgi:hypothetical protein